MKHKKVSFSAIDDHVLWNEIPVLRAVFTLHWWFLLEASTPPSRREDAASFSTTGCLHGPWSPQHREGPKRGLGRLECHVKKFAIISRLNQKALKQKISAIFSLQVRSSRAIRCIAHNRMTSIRSTTSENSSNTKQIKLKKKVHFYKHFT